MINLSQIQLNNFQITHFLKSHTLWVKNKKNKKKTKNKGALPPNTINKITKINYRRGDIPKRFMIKKKRTKLRQSRSLVVITLLIIALTMLDTSHNNISESKLNDTSLISTELNVSSIYLISKGKSPVSYTHLTLPTKA